MAKQETYGSGQTPIPAAGEDVGEAEVQDTVDAEEEKGYVGYEVDHTPNSAYTVAGVVAGEPTPETDEKAKADATKKSEG